MLAVKDFTVLSIVSSIVINMFASVPLPSSSIGAIQVDPEGCLQIRSHKGETSAPRGASGVRVSFIVLLCHISPSTGGQQTFSMKGQIVSILGFASHVWSLSHTLLLLPLLLFIYLQSLKNIKSIFSL